MKRIPAEITADFWFATRAATRLKGVLLGSDRYKRSALAQLYDVDLDNLDELPKAKYVLLRRFSPCTSAARGGDVGSRLDGLRVFDRSEADRIQTDHFLTGGSRGLGDEGGLALSQRDAVGEFGREDVGGGRGVNSRIESPTESFSTPPAADGPRP